MDQGLELSLWLGMAALALGSARLLLWHTRHVLNRSQQDAPLPAAVGVPTAMGEQAAGASMAGHQEVVGVPTVAQQEARPVSAVAKRPSGSVLAS